MKKIIRPCLSLILIISASTSLRGGVFLNEISAGGSTDWVELKLAPGTEPTDISQLFVTMYYGTNSEIADSPVTLYSFDRPETPWDDRFALIYFTEEQDYDETDMAGDLNGNRVRDLYCANYGLWNTDCCVSIDSDDDPGNNGIIDFMAFSNRDGSINSAIGSYIESASEYGMWNTCPSVNLQDCCCFTGADGMNAWSTLSRTGSPDSNSMDDFILTPYATPGRENIINTSAGRGKILKTLKSRVAHKYRAGAGVVELPLFLYTKTSLRVRIFNSAGMNVYTGPLIADATPGYLTLKINESRLKGRILTGLYPVSIEAVNPGNGRAENFGMILIILKEK